MIQVTWKYSESLVSFHDKRTLVGGDHRVRLPQTSVQPSSFCGIKVDLTSSRVQRTQRSPCGNSENICVLSFCTLLPHSLQFHKGPLRANTVSPAGTETRLQAWCPRSPRDGRAGVGVTAQRARQSLPLSESGDKHTRFHHRSSSMPSSLGTKIYISVPFRSASHLQSEKLRLRKSQITTCI